MVLNAGELNKRVVIQYQSIARDSYGAETITWTDLDTVWAKITPLRGREYFNTKQIQAEASIKVSIRYKTGLNTTMRLKRGNRYFYILEMQNVDERNEEIMMLCKEVV